MGAPQNRWFIMEIPLYMDDLGVLLFMKTPKHVWFFVGGIEEGLLMFIQGGAPQWWNMASQTSSIFTRHQPGRSS